MAVVSLVAIGLKVRIFVRQLRARRSRLGSLDKEPTNNSKRLRTHEKRLMDTSRQINMLYSSMMVGIGECLPLGCIQSELHAHMRRTWTHSTCGAHTCREAQTHRHSQEHMQMCTHACTHVRACVLGRAVLP